MIFSKESLAAALGTSLKRLHFWVYAVPIDKRYREFALQRRGENRLPRIIQAPIKPIAYP